MTLCCVDVATADDDASVTLRGVEITVADDVACVALFGVDVAADDDACVFLCSVDVDTADDDASVTLPGFDVAAAGDTCVTLCGLGILRIIEDDDDAVVAGFPDEVVARDSTISSMTSGLASVSTAEPEPCTRVTSWWSVKHTFTKLSISASRNGRVTIE